MVHDSPLLCNISLQVVTYSNRGSSVVEKSLKPEELSVKLVKLSIKLEDSTVKLVADSVPLLVKVYFKVIVVRCPRSTNTRYGSLSNS